MTNVKVCGQGGRGAWKEKARGSERGRSMRSDDPGVTHRLKKIIIMWRKAESTSNAIQIPHLIYIKKQG